MATKTITELILEYRYALHAMEVKPDGPLLLIVDNNSVVLNCTMPTLVLKKKHNVVAYHRVREAIACGIMKITYIASD